MLDEINDEALDYLGRGWSFPPSFDLDGNKINMQTDVGNIEKCIRILFTTKPSERYFWRNYGCDFEQYGFEELSLELLQKVQRLVRKVIQDYEPRVILQNVVVVPNEKNLGELDVYIDYLIRSSNIEGNLVFNLSLDGTLGVKFK